MERDGRLINPQERGGSERIPKRESKGELTMYIISTHFS
jgi:hypothetical protein